MLLYGWCSEARPGGEVIVVDRFDECGWYGAEYGAVEELEKFRFGAGFEGTVGVEIVFEVASSVGAVVIEVASRFGRMEVDGPQAVGYAGAC